MGTVELTWVGELVGTGKRVTGQAVRCAPSTDRVGDDEDVGVGAVLGGGLCKLADNRGVGVEEVITRHAGLAGDTGRDQDNLGALESCGNIGLLVSLDLCSLSMGALACSRHAFASCFIIYVRQTWC